jgi:hypothetical protein
MVPSGDSSGARPLTRRITLADRQPLASGSTRAVYVHPGDADLLIKVMRPDIIEKRYGKGRRWYKAPRRYHHFISYLREVREEIALRAQYGGRHPKSLQTVVGFVETDLGLGLVVEAVKGRGGGLAPPLPTVIGEGRFDAKAKADLQACLAELLELPIVIGDLHAANVVYAWTEEHGDHFVLIDGIGCKTLIPVNRMSRIINRYSKRRMFERLMASVARKSAAAAALPQRLSQAAE